MRSEVRIKHRVGALHPPFDLFVSFLRKQESMGGLWRPANGGRG